MKTIYDNWYLEHQIVVSRSETAVKISDGHVTNLVHCTKHI